MWAVDHEGIEPDILLTAKGIGSGMPIKHHRARRAARDMGPGTHGSTYGGNPVACAAALATIDLLEGGLIDNAAVQGERAMRALSALRDRFPDTITDVRGKGLMIGIEFDTAERAQGVEWACFERGLLVLQAGKFERPTVTAAHRERRPGRHGRAHPHRGGRLDDLTPPPAMVAAADGAVAVSAPW